MPLIFLFLFFLATLLPERTNILSKEKKIEKNIEFQIVFPAGQKQSQLNSCLNLNVLIINHTDTVTSFFEDWNS